MASNQRLDSLFEVTPKFLGELSAWLDSQKSGSFKGGGGGAPGPPGPSLTIQDEGAPLTVRPKLNFIGAGVTAVDDAANGRTNVTIPGATGGTGIDFEVSPQTGDWLTVDVLETGHMPGLNLTNEGIGGAASGIRLAEIGDGAVLIENAGNGIPISGVPTGIRMANFGSGQLYIHQTGGPSGSESLKILNDGDGLLALRSTGTDGILMRSHGGDILIKTDFGNLTLDSDGAPIFVPQLPTVDPGVADQLWSRGGDVVLSGYVPPPTGYIMPYAFDGPVAVANGLLPWEPRKPGQIVEVHCRFGNAPTGSGGTTIRVRKNALYGASGISLGQVTIPAGSVVGSFNPSPGTYALGDYFTVDIIATAGTTPGSNLVVQLLGTFDG